jgi:MinD-like ATPase involved in chromosome partitioning or flagellar assembly
MVVTFYSYKGGTGRTMALANLAWILASNGLRVLAVDWDLESPGLHRYFHPFLADPKLESTPGVLEIIREVAAKAVDVRADTEADADTTTNWYVGHANVGRHAFSLDWEFPGDGALDFLPAGCQEAGYAAAVSTFDWGNFYDRLDGGKFLAMLGRSMRDSYDYVLVDSRTGLSDIAGILTVLLPDVVINCFTLNTQSIDGALSVAAHIRRVRADRPLRILPVPMRVEDAEQVKLDAGRDYARVGFAVYLAGLSPEATERYWNAVEIPYKPFYAYEEILATFGDRPRQDTSLLASYERLAGVITEGRVTRFAPLDEGERRRWLGEFERPRPGTQENLLISYASVERTWAEWIAAELGDTGVSVNLLEVTAGSGVGYLDEAIRLLSRNSRLLVLLSQTYVSTDNARDLWKIATERAVGGGQFLVSVRLDSRRHPSPFSDRPAVDLYGLSEERARTVLLDALERQPLPKGQAAERREAARRPRYPADSPPVWNVPPRNGTFIGRSPLLEQIRERFSTNVTTPVAQALIGLGGVGKTQIAMEYAHRFAADYDIVWWISANQIGQARSILANLAVELEMSASENVTERIRAALDALRRSSRWLVVFDNADDPDELRELRPQGGGHVLITSRNPAWTQLTDATVVDVFKREESVALLRRQVPHIAEADAIELAARLGDLPLAIEQAGAWLNATAMAVDRYIELLDNELPRILAEHPPGSYPQYPDTAAATWLLSLQRMRDEMPAAAKILEICAFFAPEPIPLSLLSGRRFIEYLLPFDASLRDPILQGRVIWEIGRYALARVDPGRGSIQLHRLVQAVVANSLTKAARRENREQAHEILSAANPRDPDRAENWPAYAMLWPHVEPSGALGSANPEVRQLVIDLVRYLWRRGDIVGSQELALKTLSRRQTMTVSDDPLALILRFHLANTQRSQARYEEAYEIDREVYSRLRELLGDHHPYTLMVAQSLGADLREIGQYVSSRELDEVTLMGFRQAFGEDHPRTLMAANNLAVAQRMVGEFRYATQLDEDTLSRRRRALGPRHPHTLFSASSLGRDLREQGDYQSSRQLLEDTLTACREVMGNDHPETLRTANSLAVTYNKLADFTAAAALATDTLVLMQRVHGRDHPDTLACAVNLACDQSSLDDNEGARGTAEDALRRYRATRGDLHLLTLACENNLAIFIRKLGHSADARPLAEHATTHLRSLLGQKHHYTLLSQANVANDLFAMDEYAAARELDEVTYELLREALGPEHPDTLAAGSNLAASLDVAGDTAGAEALLATLIATSSRVLGPGHPNTLIVRDRERLNCEIEPPWV